MTFFLLAVAIMAASILFLHRIAIFFDCPIKYKPLILCAVMAFLVNFATLNISSFLTATHYAIILIFVLAASLGVTFYNARLLKKERLAASADIRGEPEAEETNETDADKTTVGKVDAIEATAEEDADEVEAAEATAEEATDEVEATGANAEEATDEVEAAATTAEETVDEVEAAATTAEETVDEVEATGANAEEATDEIEAAEANAEEATDEVEAAATTAEEATDEAEAAEANAEEAADEVEAAGANAEEDAAEVAATEPTAEGAADEVAATGANAEEDADEVAATEPTAEGAADEVAATEANAEEAADEVEADEATAEETADEAVDEEDLDLEPAVLPSEEERRRAKDELKELTEAVGRLHSMDDYLDYADRESREHHPRRAVFAYKQALGIYWNDDYAPFIAINLGNTYKEMGDYEAASETYEAALTLPATQKSVAMQQEFHRSVGYLRTVQHILASHGIAHTPFAQIPPEISAEIESAAQEA